MTQSLMRERLMKKNGETGVGLDPISTYQGKPSQCSTPYFRQPGVSGSGRVASQAEISGSGTLSFVLGRGKQLIGIGLTRARASVLSLGCWAARARALHFFLTTTSSYHVVAQFKSMSGTIMVSYHPSLSLSLSLSRLKVIQKLKTESLTFLHFSPLSPHRRFVDRNRRNDDDDGGDDDQFLKNSNC